MYLIHCHKDLKQNNKGKNNKQKNKDNKSSQK